MGVDNAMNTLKSGKPKGRNGTRKHGVGEVKKFKKEHSVNVAVSHKSEVAHLKRQVTRANNERGIANTERDIAQRDLYVAQREIDQKNIMLARWSVTTGFRELNRKDMLCLFRDGLKCSKDEMDKHKVKSPWALYKSVSNKPEVDETMWVYYTGMSQQSVRNLLQYCEQEGVVRAVYTHPPSHEHPLIVDAQMELILIKCLTLPSRGTFNASFFARYASSLKSPSIKS